MSEDRMTRIQFEEKVAPKRECPVPKPGGLLGQVLGVKKDDEEDRRPVSVQVERVRKEAQSKNDQ